MDLADRRLEIKSGMCLEVSVFCISFASGSRG